MIGRLSRLAAFYALKPQYEEPSDPALGDDQLAEVLGEYPDVTALDLRGCTNLTSAAIASLRALPQLVALNLSTTRIESEALGELATFPSLRIAVLNETAIRDGDAARLLACRRLRELSLNQTAVGNRAIVATHGFRLRRLGLNGTAIDDRAVAALARFGYIGLLGVQGTGVTDDGVTVLAARDMTWTLNIAGCRVTDEGFGRLASMKNLRHLFCDGIAVTDALDAMPPNLEILDAANTAIGDDAVTKLTKCLLLRRLRLFGTRVTDACVPSLLRMDLELLDIRETSISDGARTALLAHFGAEVLLDSDVQAP
ncbi:MAG TPA: hypothetical protein VF432_14885 [Thermoanaerobaculia bacterium]